MLPRPTIRKIVREIFIVDGEDCLDGMKVAAKKQEKWLTDLAASLTKIDRVEASVRDGFYIALKIRESITSGRNLEWFMLNFFPYEAMTVRTDRTGLWIADATYKRRRKAETEAPVQDVAHILEFIEAVKERQDRAKLRAQRNSKLAGLKQKSLQSRLTDLAEEHGFSFALGENKRDVNLSIRVCGKKSAYHVAFPKGKLDAVLEQVPDLVKTLETLRKLGINFRTNNKPWAHNQSEWFEPESSSKV